MKNLEKTVNKYIKGLKKKFPRFDKYLKLCNEISSHVIDIYDAEIVPTDLSHSTYFSNIDSVYLALEIINNISPELGMMFVKKINDRSIMLVKGEFSYTSVQNDIVYSKVEQTNTFQDAIVLIHEFFHNVHLDLYKGDINNEDFYFFTEIFGIFADIYSAYYLIYSRKEYVEDSKIFLSKVFNGVVGHSDVTLIKGTILDIYNEFKSLDDSAISNYVVNHNLSEAYLDILSFEKDVDKSAYHQSSIYVFAFPIAFDLAFNLLCIKDYSVKFKDMFLNINKYKPEEWLHKLDLDTHFDNSEELLNIMNNIYHNIKDVYGENKVKKLGGL